MILLFGSCPPGSKARHSLLIRGIIEIIKFDTFGLIASHVAFALQATFDSALHNVMFLQAPQRVPSSNKRKADFVPFLKTINLSFFFKLFQMRQNDTETAGKNDDAFQRRVDNIH